MLLRLFIFFFFVSFSFKGFTCLNFYYSVDKHGVLHEISDLQVAFNTNFNPKLIESKLKKKIVKLRDKKDFRLLSDYAVLLLKAGKKEESLEIFIRLERHYPNQYQIVSNLGTAYELNGNLDSALFFINKGIDLNPDSHKGSEWVHARILLTKFELINSSSYLLYNSVLQLSEEDKKSKEIRDQILLQVRERFPFSPKGQNEIMSSLLIDLGDCFSYSGSIEYAIALYTIASDYYRADAKITNSKIELIQHYRDDYSNITTEDMSVDGMAFKIEKISIKSLLDDNNNPPYEINWEEITIDPTLLLSYVDFFLPIEEEKEEVTEEVFINNPETTAQTEKNSNADVYFLRYSILSGIILLVFGFFVYKKTK